VFSGQLVVPGRPQDGRQQVAQIAVIVDDENTPAGFRGSRLQARRRFRSVRAAGGSHRGRRAREHIEYCQELTRSELTPIDSSGTDVRRWTECHARRPRVGTPGPAGTKLMRPRDA